MKIPLFVEIFGEPATGKTHFSLLFPSPVILDTTPKGEALVIVRKLYPNEVDKRWIPVRSFKDIRLAVEKYCNEPWVKTIVVDTSANLQDLAILEWLSERKGRERPLPFEYKEIRDKIDRVIEYVMQHERNLVFTSQMKDEYTADGKKTGRRVRDGYVKTPFMADIVLRMVLLEGNPVQRKVVVVKNRFRDMANPQEWISEIRPCWEDIIKLTGLPEEVLVC